MGSAIEFDAEARAEFDEALTWYAERSKGAARLTQTHRLLPLTRA